MEKKRNLWVTPTDKPSRLHFDDKLFLSTRHQLSSSINSIVEGRNIYITSDEEIKDLKPHKGKWHLEGENILNKFPDYLTDLSECKLVIMTTDQDLIKDGVQAIGDEFLEWFVKNPSCGEVEVTQLCKIGCNKLILNGVNSICCGDKDYKIIIPKKEPKQTIEEAAEIHARQSWGVYFDDNHPDITITQTQGEISISDFIAGAKWQAERMYSEEDLREAFRQGMENLDPNFPENMDYSEMYGWSSKLTEQEWFEQFSKLKNG